MCSLVNIESFEDDLEFLYHSMNSSDPGNKLGVWTSSPQSLPVASLLRVPDYLCIVGLTASDIGSNCQRNSDIIRPVTFDKTFSDNKISRELARTDWLTVQGLLARQRRLLFWFDLFGGLTAGLPRRPWTWIMWDFWKWQDLGRDTVDEILRWSGFSFLFTV